MGNVHSECGGDDKIFPAGTIFSAALACSVPGRRMHERGEGVCFRLYLKPFIPADTVLTLPTRTRGVRLVSVAAVEISPLSRRTRRLGWGGFGRFLAGLVSHLGYITSVLQYDFFVLFLYSAIIIFSL